MTSFDGETVIITGAASGIGRATVLRFAADGANVICTDRDAEGLAETVELAGGSPTAVAGDLMDPELPDQIVAKAGDRVDSLINVAGLFDSFTAVDQTDDVLWDRILTVNITAPMRFCRAVIPRMLEAERGSIVNIASVAGLTGIGGGAAYSSSKHAVIGLTRHISAVFGPRGVRCNAICPAGVETAIEAHGIGNPADWVMERLGPILSAVGRRSADPSEIAALIAFLCSPEAINIDGAAIPTDSGWTAL